MEDGRVLVDDSAEVLRGLSPVIRELMAETGASDTSDTVPLVLDVGMWDQAQQTLEDVIRMSVVPNDFVAAEPIPWSRLFAAYQYASTTILALEPAWLATAAAFVSLSCVKIWKAFPLEDLVQWTELATLWPELWAQQGTLAHVYTCAALCLPETDTATSADVVDRMAVALKGVLDHMAACGMEDESITFLDRCVRPDVFACVSAAMRQLLAGVIDGRAEQKWDRIRAYLVHGLVSAGLFNDALRVAEAPAADPPRRFLLYSEAGELLRSLERAEEKGEMQAWCALVRDYTSEQALRDAYIHLRPDLAAGVLPHLNFS